MDKVTQDEINEYSQKGNIIQQKYNNGELTEEEYQREMDTYQKEGLVLGKSIQQKVLKSTNKYVIPMVIVSIIIFVLIIYWTLR